MEEINKLALQIVRARAAEAGWKIKTDQNDNIVLGFQDPLGIENIYIKPCGQNSERKIILEFSGDGIPLPEEPAAAAIFGLMLLERNADMIMGHWGIENLNGNKFFTVYHTMVAEGMDVHEFRAAVLACLNEKKRIIAEFLQSQQQEFDLNFEFESSDHIRYENKQKVSGPHGGARRMIKVQDNITGNDGFTVTVYNMDGDHPVWQNNVQMAPKQMKIESRTNDKISLRGYGLDNMGFSFKDYGLTIHLQQNQISKCTLHMFDRNVDIEYLV